MIRRRAERRRPRPCAKAPFWVTRAQSGVNDRPGEVSMRYMMLMYSRETAEGPSEEEVEYLIRTHGGVVADARKKGALLAIE